MLTKKFRTAVVTFESRSRTNHPPLVAAIQPASGSEKTIVLPAKTTDLVPMKSHVHRGFSEGNLLQGRSLQKALGLTLSSTPQDCGNRKENRHGTSSEPLWHQPSRNGLRR